MVLLSYAILFCIYILYSDTMYESRNVNEIS